jgi:hypothetical protein
MARLSLLKPELKAAAIDIKDDRKAYVLWHISLVFLGASPVTFSFLTSLAGQHLWNFPAHRLWQARQLLSLASCSSHTP